MHIAMHIAMFHRRTSGRALVAGCALVAACGGGSSERSSATAAHVDVMVAASVTKPIRAVLDTFAAANHVTYSVEPGASLEIARRINELGRNPDIVILADPDVFAQYIGPAKTSWYALFARDHMVIAYTPRSRGADRINASNWRDVVTSKGVEVGRADPSTDPSGYRALISMKLAEMYYKQPGLAQRLLAAAPSRNVRPREADQVALVQAHALDYIWTYESIARGAALDFIALPSAIDLGDPAYAAAYARASVRVPALAPNDSVTMTGAPILFALSIPSDGSAPRARPSAPLHFSCRATPRASSRRTGSSRCSPPSCAARALRPG